MGPRVVNKIELQSSLIDKAATALNEGQLDQAEEHAQEFIELGAGTIPAHGGWILGLIRSRQGRYPEALQFLEPLTRMAQWQGYAPLFRALYIAAYHSGDVDKALAAGERAVQIDPTDLVFQNELWFRKALRGLPLSTGVDQLSSFLPFLENQPIRQDCPVLYRLSALILATNGKKEEALGIYLPFLECSIRRKENRSAWYGYSAVTTAEDMASQSQRFGANEQQLAGEFETITGILRMDGKDSVADIGGAGGLFAREIADIAQRVVITDVSQELVEHSTKQLGALANVECLCHDITATPLPERFDKILMSSVTPCFPTFGALESAMENIFAMLSEGGRAFISNNYDIASSRAAAETILEPTNAISAYQALTVYENMLWLDIAEIEQLACRIGYQEFTVVNQRTLPDGRRMFDCLLVK